MDSQPIIGGHHRRRSDPGRNRETDSPAVELVGTIHREEKTHEERDPSREQVKKGARRVGEILPEREQDKGQDSQQADHDRRPKTPIHCVFSDVVAPSMCRAIPRGTNHNNKKVHSCQGVHLRSKKSIFKIFCYLERSFSVFYKTRINCASS